MRLRVIQFTCARLMCALLGASACLSAQTRSVISGTVLDENGNPVTSAQVRIIGLKPQGKVVPSDFTGERGEFAIEGLAWGTYMLSAVKERDGYPVGLWDLYANGPRTTAALSPTSPAVSVTIRIGPRAGVLAATVIDALTGKDVPSASITVDWFYPGGTGQQRAEAVSVGPGQGLPVIVALQPVGQR